MKIVSLFSGGLDSTVLLCSLLNDEHEVYPLSIYYGQRHRKELDAADTILTELRQRTGMVHSFRGVDLGDLKTVMRGSSQTDDNVEVPHGHYAAENMKITIVPNRNMIMLSVAAALAISEDCDAIAFAAHAGDHAIYPDCRPRFVLAVENALHMGNDKQLGVMAPFIGISKGDIVKQGDRIGIRDIMAMTWSCYEGGEAHCGECGTCVERREAFQQANIPDPTVYA